MLPLIAVLPAKESIKVVDPVSPQPPFFPFESQDSNSQLSEVVIVIICS